jgi:hypothetical protein
MQGHQTEGRPAESGFPASAGDRLDAGSSYE